MSIELTEQQQQALDTQTEVPPRVIDPRSNVAYYLVAATDYEVVRELLEDERRQKAIRAIGLRNAVGRVQLLETFDTLSEAEKHEVAVEILRRSALYEDVPEATLVELADDLFRVYDAEGAAERRAALDRRDTELDANPEIALTWEQIRASVEKKA